MRVLGLKIIGQAKEDLLVVRMSLEKHLIVKFNIFLDDICNLHKEVNESRDNTNEMNSKYDLGTKDISSKYAFPLSMVKRFYRNYNKRWTKKNG